MRRGVPRAIWAHPRAPYANPPAQTAHECRAPDSEMGLSPAIFPGALSSPLSRNPGYSGPAPRKTRALPVWSSSRSRGAGSSSRYRFPPRTLSGSVGINFRLSSCFIWAKTSRPSILGRFRSSRIRSGRTEPACGSSCLRYLIASTPSCRRMGLYTFAGECL
jgi:hypothetical protein